LLQSSCQMPGHITSSNKCNLQVSLIFWYKIMQKEQIAKIKLGDVTKWLNILFNLWNRSYFFFYKGLFLELPILISKY
jgi:hypothetical protein